MIFPDITIPGYLLRADELESLIERATEILDETGPDSALSKFIADASRLRAAHDGKFGGKKEG